MKFIILAAGQGTRLRPFTCDRPKCMVELKGKPLLQYQLETLYDYGVSYKNIALVGGYLQEALVAPGIRQYRNARYDDTNMVTTLFVAQKFMTPGEDLIVSYGDILYQKEVLETLIETPGELVVAADLDWYQLWSQRMVDPMTDVETFKITKDNKILELGKKPNDKQDIHAQYIGLIKIRGDKVSDFIHHYTHMDKFATYDGKNFDNMYMTSFIQDLINNNWEIQAALINGGWLEVDTVSDLEVYERRNELF